MSVKIRTKLYSGFGFLFFVILLLWVLSSMFIFKFFDSSEKMLKDNYQSIVYAKKMLASADEIKNIQIKCLFSGKILADDDSYKTHIAEFENILAAEQKNITEVGEKELVQQLKNKFNNNIGKFPKLIIRNDKEANQEMFNEVLDSFKEIKNLILNLSDMNMQAIVRKNNNLKELSHDAYLYISVIGTICLLISFSILLNFPNDIARRINALINGIREISNRNYEQKIQFDTKDEFKEVADAFNTMAVKLRDYENSNISQILFEKKRVDTVINSMHDAIIGLNENKEIIFINSIACSLLNLKDKEIVGKYAHDIASQNDLFYNIIKDLMNGSYKAKEFNPIRIFSENKQSYFTKEILDVIIKDEKSNNNLIGYVIILKNITKYLELDESKTNFIATISHELKTPISSSRLNIKLLEDIRVGELNNEQKNILQIIRAEINRMQQITKELIDMAQLESGVIQLKIIPTDPISIIKEAHSAITNFAEQKNVNIKLANLGNLKLINADREKSSWVLINFIHNAIKFSASNGDVLVNAVLSDDYVKFSVTDFGKGIESKYLTKIFERYFSLPDSSADSTGMGLAIAKEFITKQNGEIWATSEIGKGSTFYFTLPLFNIDSNI